MVKSTTTKAKQPVKAKAPLSKAKLSAAKKAASNNSPWRKRPYSDKQKQAVDLPSVDVQKVIEEVTKDKDCIVLRAFKDLVVIGKGIQITVNRTNTNPVFQPHDYTQNKTYCIMAIIEFNNVDGSKDEIIRGIKVLGCPVFRIRHHGEVEYILKELN